MPMMKQMQPTTMKVAIPRKGFLPPGCWYVCWLCPGELSHWVGDDNHQLDTPVVTGNPFSKSVPIVCFTRLKSFLNRQGCSPIQYDESSFWNPLLSGHPSLDLWSQVKLQINFSAIHWFHQFSAFSTPLIGLPLIHRSQGFGTYTFVTVPSYPSSV